MSRAIFSAQIFIIVLLRTEECDQIPLCMRKSDTPGEGDDGEPQLQVRAFGSHIALSSALLQIRFEPALQ